MKLGASHELFLIVRKVLTPLRWLIPLEMFCRELVFLNKEERKEERERLLSCDKVIRSYRNILRQKRRAKYLLRFQKFLKKLGN